MAYYKLRDGLYSEESDMIMALNYICNPIKCSHEIIGGRNIIGIESFDPNFYAEQFQAVQYQRRFEKRIYHMIISFDEALDKPDLTFAYQVGMAVTGMYGNYQSIFTVHEDKPYLHLHIIFNNCAVSPNVKNLTYIFDLYAVRKMVDGMIDNRLGIFM